MVFPVLLDSFFVFWDGRFLVGSGEIWLHIDVLIQGDGGSSFFVFFL